MAATVGSECAFVFRRADGTIITQDCPWGFRALKRRATRIASALFSAVLTISVARAKPIPQQNPQPTEEEQKLQSSLAVTVVDPQGAVVPHAQVTLTGPKTKPGPKVTGVTNDMGKVEFPSLAAGEYAITVTAKYFLMERQTSVFLAAGKSQNLEIKMKIDPKTTITVTVGVVAEAPLIQQNAQVSHTFEMDQ